MANPRNNGDPDILLVLAGGTIDAVKYKKTPKFVTPTAESVVPDFIKNLAGGWRIAEPSLDWKRQDSQLFTDEDMAELAHIIISSPHDKIIVTFGTDAMVKRAAQLDDMLKSSGAGGNPKTVVFVGAMKPLEHGRTSDGLENMQYALQKIDDFPPGVRLVGRERKGVRHFGPNDFDPHEARKNRHDMTFEDPAGRALRLERERNKPKHTEDRGLER